MPNSVLSTTIFYCVCFPAALVLLSVLLIVQGNQLVRRGQHAAARFFATAAVTIVSAMLYAISNPYTLMTSVTDLNVHLLAWAFVGLTLCITTVYVVLWMETPDPWNWEED